MTDIRGNIVAIGDKVAILHKKRPSTTATLKVGIVIKVAKTATVKVDGLNTTRHTNKTLIKII